MITVNLLSATSAAVDVTSVPYDLGDLKTFSIDVDFSGGGGDLAGTLTLESCSTSTGTFKTVANSSQAVTSSAGHMWSLDGQGYRFVRVKWAYTSGTGNIAASLVVKETRFKGA